MAEERFSGRRVGRGVQQREAGAGGACPGKQMRHADAALLVEVRRDDLACRGTHAKRQVFRSRQSTDEVVIRPQLDTAVFPVIAEVHHFRGQAPVAECKTDLIQSSATLERLQGARVEEGSAPQNRVESFIVEVSQRIAPVDRGGFRGSRTTQGNAARLEGLQRGPAEQTEFLQFGVLPDPDPQRIRGCLEQSLDGLQLALSPGEVIDQCPRLR